MIRHLPLAGLLLCAACASPPPISSSPVQDIAAAAPPSAPQATIVEGLQNASFNLDNAVAVGALDKTDAAPACLHSILTDLGIDPANPVTPATSFVPKVSDLISGASVVYIRARQAEKLAASGGPNIGVACKALIGQIVIDGAKAAGAAAAATTPAGMINAILPIPIR